LTLGTLGIHGAAGTTTITGPMTVTDLSIANKLFMTGLVTSANNVVVTGKYDDCNGDADSDGRLDRAKLSGGCDGENECGTNITFGGILSLGGNVTAGGNVTETHPLTLTGDSSITPAERRGSRWAR